MAMDEPNDMKKMVKQIEMHKVVPKVNERLKSFSNR
jgi:hypothetical protein